VQVAVGVAALLVLVTAADAISGDRERGVLESLLLTPAPRWVLVTGKGAAAMSLWLAAYLVSVPYIVYLARGTGVLTRALVAGFLVGTLIALFLDEAPRRLAALWEAAEREEAHALEREAHTLKGSCANFGARRLAGLCEQLEALGRAHDLASAADALAQLEVEFERVRAALGAELAQV
jgi:HPt (histidine-containing phosphotransfer) domain-containing protein